MIPSELAFAFGGLNGDLIFCEFKGNGDALILASFEMATDLPVLDRFSKKDGVEGQEYQGKGEVSEFGIPESQAKQSGQHSYGKNQELEVSE